jgi:hypothetical protein
LLMSPFTPAGQAHDYRTTVTAFEFFVRPPARK